MLGERTSRRVSSLLPWRCKHKPANHHHPFLLLKIVLYMYTYTQVRCIWVFPFVVIRVLQCAVVWTFYSTKMESSLGFPKKERKKERKRRWMTVRSWPATCLKSNTFKVDTFVTKFWSCAGVGWETYSCDAYAEAREVVSSYLSPSVRVRCVAGWWWSLNGVSFLLSILCSFAPFQLDCYTNAQAHDIRNAGGTQQSRLFIFI